MPEPGPRACRAAGRDCGTVTATDSGHLQVDPRYLHPDVRAAPPRARAPDRPTRRIQETPRAGNDSEPGDPRDGRPHPERRGHAGRRPDRRPDAAPAPPGSRARAIGLAALVGAVGIGAIAIAIVAGGPRNDAAPAAADRRVGTRRRRRSARCPGGPHPTAPTTSASTVAGRAGMRGAMGGAISITAIDGTKLALKTDNGWTRTIDAAGATVTKDGATVALSTLAVGDRIVFRETRNADGTFTITAIEVIQPAVAGTVASVSGSTVTVTQRDKSTSKVVLTGSTVYRLAGKPATKDAVVDRRPDRRPRHAGDRRHPHGHLRRGRPGDGRRDGEGEGLRLADAHDARRVHRRRQGHLLDDLPGRRRRGAHAGRREGRRRRDGGGQPATRTAR